MPIDQITIYEDERGRQIVARTPQILGSLLPGKTAFNAVNMAMTPQGPIQFAVPLDADDIHQAFAQLDVQVAERQEHAFNEHMRKLHQLQKDMQLRQQLTLGGKEIPLQVKR